MQIVDALSRIVGESESEMWKLTFSLMQMVDVHLSVLISIFECPVAAFCTFLVTDRCAHCTASKIQGYKLQFSHHTDIPYSAIASLSIVKNIVTLCNWFSFSYSNVQFMAEICFKLIHITDIWRLIGGHHLPTASDDLAVEADRWRHEDHSPLLHYFNDPGIFILFLHLCLCSFLQWSRPWWRLSLVSITWWRPKTRILTIIWVGFSSSNIFRFT